MYVLTMVAMLPAASAMHELLEHEHGPWRIWNSLAILVMLLLLLAFALGRWLGVRADRARQAAHLDAAYADLDTLRDRNDRHEEETKRFREQLRGLRSMGVLLDAERRSANAMAIMMA